MGVNRRTHRVRLIIECPEDIPCNPCEDVCPQGAITVGHPITNLPVLDAVKCDGCGVCIAACPAQAIFIVKAGTAKNTALVGVPYEMLPPIRTKEQVGLLDSDGTKIGSGQVERVARPPAFEQTVVVYVECLTEIAHRVRALGKV